MNTKNIVLVCACLFLANAAYAATQEVDSPETLISRARVLEDVWTQGTPPSLMRAEVQVFDAKGTTIRGDYTLDWVSPFQWREEIRFVDYDRLRVRDAKGYWQRSGLRHQPEIIFQLDTLLRPKDVLNVEPKQTLGKVRNRRKDQARERCTEVKWAKATDRVMCFDEVSGALVSVEYPNGENQHLPEISRIEYGAFNAVDGHLFPYEIRALQDRRVIASVKILQIAKAEHDPSLFKLPVNAEFWEQCDDMREAELVDHPYGRYPPSARTNHEQGRVIIYAVIETDGRLSHMAIIHRAPPNLEAAALEAVRQWHYKPATCGQTPIRTETSIAMDFWLEY